MLESSWLETPSSDDNLQLYVRPKSATRAEVYQPDGVYNCNMLYYSMKYRRAMHARATYNTARGRPGADLRLQRETGGSTRAGLARRGSLLRQRVCGRTAEQLACLCNLTAL